MPKKLSARNHGAEYVKLRMAPGAQEEDGRRRGRTITGEVRRPRQTQVQSLRGRSVGR